MFSLKDKEVNVGRQRELDLVKGFLMIMIVFIHSFQSIAGAAAAESNVHKILFALFMPTGACLYLFTMGFGSVFTRHSEPKDMVRYGVRILVYQGLCNLCYAAAIIICFHIRILLTGEVAGSRELYEANLYSVLTFVNIFFISGMCYLVLAIYRKLEVKLSGYIISAVIVGILSPFTKLLISDNQALNWILDMTFGGKGETSFCFFPYLSYVFLGYVFGKVIRRVPENEKGEFYKKSGTVCGVIAVIWFVLAKLKPFLESQDQLRRTAILALAFCFLMAYVSEKFFGIADITGAYFAGLMLCSMKIETYVNRRVEIPAYLIFSPVFFASIGMKTNLDGLNGSMILFSIILLIIAILSKVVGCGLGAKICKCTNKEALRIGVGMISRGEVALIVAQKGYQAGMLSDDLFAPIVLVVIVTTLITPILLSMVFKGEKPQDTPAAPAESANI